MRKTAINIKTEVWNEIIDGLMKKGWIVTAKYWGFDAGIDDDYLVMRKGFKKITFGWSNWEEGEIQSSEKLFQYLENMFNVNFEYGKPTNLDPKIRWTFCLQSLPLFVLKVLKLD